MAVLDATLEPIPGEQNSIVVYYSILDGDERGRSPIDPYFNSSTKSCLQKIAKSNNKVGIVEYTSAILVYITEKTSWLF